MRSQHGERGDCPEGVDVREARSAGVHGETAPGPLGAPGWGGRPGAGGLGGRFTGLLLDRWPEEALEPKRGALDEVETRRGRGRGEGAGKACGRPRDVGMHDVDPAPAHRSSSPSTMVFHRKMP